MKPFILFLALAAAINCSGQNTEFTIYSNGLIYSEHTMDRLRVIVDSLNVKFRSCDLAHPYYALSQGMAMQVKVPSKEVLKKIKEGISREAFIKAYPKLVEKDNTWLIKSRYPYKDRELIQYEELPGDTQASITLPAKKEHDKVSGWIVSDKGESAFYLDKLEARELPYDYARLVQYVDCMIDTTTEIYLPEAKRLSPVEESSKARQFIAWAEKFPDELSYPIPEKLSYDEYKKLDKESVAATYRAYVLKRARLDSLRLQNLDERMNTSPYFRSLLEEAAEEALSTGASDERLEFYIARYRSKEDALKLKRSRRVIGRCSMDRSPRAHAMSICQLAAETAKWEIFLRAHLDIMNDRFERMSDGSYAWAGRKTYLKELETLEIPTVDLLLGTALHVQNVSIHHYWGSINRIGRALTDTEDKDTLEARLQKMIEDPALDPYNRLLFCYLYSHYTAYLEDPARKVSNQKKLIQAVNTLPGFAKERWAAIDN
jgi:hypothetical protein